jgi:hypothetical protein
VMATANHYLLDALAGVACVFLGDWLARRIPVVSRRRGSVRRQRVSD